MNSTICPKTKQYGNLCFSRDEASVISDQLDYVFNNVSLGRRQALIVSSARAHLQDLVAQLVGLDEDESSSLSHTLVSWEDDGEIPYDEDDME
jgi:hypothetical protein